MTVAEGRVSVIIPVYQGEACVANAIKSALNQTYKDIEILVIDDGSTDKTWDVLTQFSDARVNAFRQDNAGVSVARNFGLSKASGEYIAFLDADDLWLPHKLESEVAAFRARNNPVGIVYSWYYCVNDNGMLSRPSPAVKHSGNVLDRLLNASPFIIPSASLFHRAIFDSVGAFDTKRRYHEDFAFLLRVCREHSAFPTERYSAIYKQSMSGKARRVMQDYDAAVEASQSIAADLGDVLTLAESHRLRENLRRELYFRFLMYGFDDFAKRLLRDIPTSSLKGGAKGWLGWLFAKTNINLMMPARTIVQRSLQVFGRSQWEHFLKRSGVSETIANVS